MVDIGAVGDNGVVAYGDAWGDEDVISQFYAFAYDDITVANGISVEDVFVGAMGEDAASGAHSTFLL